MKTAVKYSVLAAVIILGACQKEEFSIKDKTQVSEEKGTNLSFDFKAEQLTLTAEEVTDESAFGRRGAHTSLVFQDNMWVIAGLQGDLDNGIWAHLDNGVWYSEDGANWSAAVGDTPFSERIWHASTVFQDKMWVVGGVDAGGVLNDVWSSTDGVVWEQATANGKFTKRRSHTLTAFNNALWLIGGVTLSEESGYVDELLADIWMSYNGRNWYRITDDAPFEERYGHAALIHDNKLWVIGGYGSPFESPKSDVWYTSDGFNWTQASPDGFNYGLDPQDGKFLPRGAHEVVSNGEWMWLTAGDVGIGGPMTGQTNDIWRSKNGADWHEVRTTMPYPERNAHSSLIFNNKLWVITGFDIEVDPITISDIWSFDIPRSSPADFKQK